MAEEPDCFSTVSALREAFGRGRLSPVDLVEESLSRIESVQPRLNCFVQVWADEARGRARALAGDGVDADQPLWGIPLAIKDTTPWSDHLMTQGSQVFRHDVADRTAAVVDALQRAGAIIVGSTNTPEFAHASITDNLLWGATRNPWNPDRSPGGSSGGAAVAVATGCVVLAEGSDMGGSVRIPASWCGIVGLKPSLGRIPMDALPGSWDTLSHHGPLGRCVDDVWEFLLATQGPSRRDPWSVLSPLVDGRADEQVSDLRIGLSIDLGCWAVHPEIAGVTERAAAALSASGVIVEPVDPGFTAADMDLWISMWSVFMAGYFGHLLDGHRSELDPDVVWLVENGLRMTAAAYKRLELRRSDVWTRIMSVFDRYDLVLCPTMAQPPKPATKLEERRRVRPAPDGRFHADDMTTVWNLVAPCPAISVPGGRFGPGPDEGLPIGVQIIGRPGREDQVLAVARRIEEWSGSPTWRPPS